MTWLTMYHNFNADKIESYNVLAHMEDYIKKLKKKCVTKEEFAEQLKCKLMSHYWARCEYELMITITYDSRIMLYPWVGSRNPNGAAIDVTDVTDFDWKAFANKYVKTQMYKNDAKIDIWNQIEFRWTEFIDYCWYYKHKYQRKDSRFYKTTST